MLAQTSGKMMASFFGVVMRALNLVGERFGQWLVLSRAKNTKNGNTRFLCRCDCGTEKEVSSSNLKYGQSTGCGHDKGARIRASKIKHGAFVHGQWHPLYNTWHSMHDRCSNPKNSEYHRYGARGITVCDAWDDFNQFVSDVGEKPTPQHTIDRFPDGNGNYEPSNVRWATKSEQNINRRTTVWLTHDGKTMCAAEWAKHLGFTKEGLYARLRRMSIEDALSTPKIPRGQYHRWWLT